MRVKCPKCRLRFDVPASPGMTELQCNCPRCGVPFTYAVGDGDAAEVDETTMDNEVTTSEDIVNHDATSHHTDRNTSSGVVPPPIPGQVFSSRTAQDFRRTNSAINASSRVIPNQGQRKKQGCFKRLFIMITIIVLTAVLINRQCESSKSYTAHSVGITSADDSDFQAEPMETPTPSYDKNATHEKAPSWIQGNWFVDTEYGGVSIKIDGDNVAETSGGETAYGKFKYQNYHLYCDFGNNDKMTYRLDVENHRIDAGDGMWMHKTE